jgi:integrase
MANLLSRNGWLCVQFYHPNTGKRCTIATRTKDEKKALVIQQRIESVVGSMIDAETLAWLKNPKNKRFRKQLIDFGLLEPGANDKPSMTLEAFLADYEARRTDTKPLTRVVWQKAFKNLKAFFGKDCPISKITVAQAREYERYLKSKRIGNDKPKPLAPATLAKQIVQAKQFFNDALERKLVDCNPFQVIKVSRGTNRTRDFFVTREMTTQVIDACPEAQWRLIVALCRYGGLRCPSEVLAVTWDDVDWERKRIRIPSEKTEHHEGGGERIIPLFPELVEPLKDCFDLAGVGIETPSSARLITRYSSAEQNPVSYTHLTLPTKA